MAAHPVTHPSADALRAFALGKLNDISAAALMNHLDGCRDCCKQVAAISGDDFLARLRQARSHSSTSTPAKALSETAGGRKPEPSRPALADIPPELAANQQYEIQRELGRGGMGVVYLAKNKLMDRLEVLKVVNKTLLDHPGAVERFLREIRSAAKLSHANVVTAYSAVQQGELLAFAMEYIEGQDLASLVKSQGPLPIPNACYYVQQAAMGLQHAYEKGMVHRDIKPQNLILAREGKKHIVKVLDFGLAKVIREKNEDTGLTGEGKMLGTPDYIAPEQTLDAAHADIRADIYSLGCTLYYLLSGHPPFSATSLGAILVAHQMHEAKPLNLVRPEVPEELAAVVCKMMAKSPAKRYQTPMQVVQALAPFVKPGATAKPPPELSSGPVESKTAVKKAAEGDRSAAPEAKVAKKQPKSESIQESLMKNSDSADESRRRGKYSDLTIGSLLPRSIPFVGTRKSRAGRKSRAASARGESRKKWLIGGGISLGVLLLALLGMWAGGVFKVKTADGTLVLEKLPLDAEVLVDGARVTVTWGDGGSKAEIRVKPGTRKVEVKNGGFAVYGEEVQIAEGGQMVISARWEPPAKAEAANRSPPPVAKLSPSAGERAAGEEGFEPLFNGKNLAGWSVDGGPANQWVVEGTTIVGQCKHYHMRNYLLSDKDYADFILRLDYRVEDGSNGAVAIRAIEGEKVPYNNSLVFDHPMIKLTNPALEERVPTGMTFWLKSDAAYWRPVEMLTLPTGIWHSMEVIVRGDNCTATVNGKKLVNVTLDPVSRNGSSFVPGLGRRKGKVGFQIHTGIMRFRNIEIKEWAAARTRDQRPIGPGGEENGFKPLFNGKDLTGWEVNEGGKVDLWSAENGILHVNGSGGWLMTEKEYSDFELHLEFKLSEKTNSGVALRSAMKGNPARNAGMEIQLLDNDWYTKNFKGMKPELRTGSIWGIVPPSRNALKPIGEWNTMRIVAKGRKVTVVLNGTEILSANLDAYKTKAGTFPGMQRTTGHIGLQSSDGHVEFRKIAIKEPK